MHDHGYSNHFYLKEYSRLKDQFHPALLFLAQLAVSTFACEQSYCTLLWRRTVAPVVFDMFYDIHSM